MPFHAPPATDERSALRGFLAQQQSAFRAAVHGLTDEQAGAKPTRSALSVGVLVKHVAQVQEGWLRSALSAPELPRDERSDEMRSADWEAEFTWTEDDTVADAVARLDDVSARVLAAVDRLDLDTAVPVPGDPWDPPDVEAWSVRWVWLHLMEELARHAGHADIIREAVDGATMYELVAAADGLPATDWLTPWSPSEQGATTQPDLTTPEKEPT